MNRQIRCIETGEVFKNVSHLSVKLKVYEEFILRHLYRQAPTLLGRTYEYI